MLFFSRDSFEACLLHDCMNDGGGMAKQQPEQPYFIPRVAGVPQPPPQTPLQPQVQFSPELEAPVETLYSPAVAAPPPPPPTHAAFIPPPFIGRTPFPAPPQRGGGVFRAMAHYCWMAVILSIGINLVLNAARLPLLEESSRMKGIILGVLWASGILSGIIALFGMRRHGRKGILIPALVGLFLWMALVALTALMVSMLPMFQEIAARENAAGVAETTAVPDSAPASSSPSTPAPAPASELTRKTEAVPQSTAVHPPGSTRVEDTELGFSMALLEGYTLPPDAGPGEKHHYKRKFMTEPTRIIEVKKFDGEVSRHLASAENFPPPAAGQKSESAVFDWRGRKVGGTRCVDTTKNPAYLTFNVVIPLRKQAIVVTVGGAQDYEPVLQEVVDQVLGSLEEGPGS